MGDSSFYHGQRRAGRLLVPLPERWIALEGTYKWRCTIKTIRCSKLLNVTARNTGPVLDICDGVVSLALESRVGWGVGRMTEINRSSLLAKLQAYQGHEAAG